MTKRYDRLKERDFADEIQDDLLDFNEDDYIYCYNCDDYHHVHELEDMDDGAYCPINGNRLMDENGNTIKYVAQVFEEIAKVIKPSI
jgi:hypothetical protein